VTIEHKDIETEQRHNKKGFKEAPDNRIHSKNSQGNVEWIDLDTIGGNPASHATRHLPETGADKLPTVEPQTIGEANDVGTSNDFVRGDHVHDHGVQSRGDMHEIATDAKHGFMSKENKTKLDTIEPNAKDDQTAGEIKSLYESNANTNEYDDVEKAKLGGIENGATQDQTGAEIKTAYEAEADTNAFTDAEKAKLNNIEAGGEVNQTDAEIKVQYENNVNTNGFTDAEKAKLAALETSKFLGEYASLTALQTAHPSPVVGSYANVDLGAGQDVVKYLWDNDDSQYILQLGESTILTDAQIKTQYENNADTNAFQDAEKTKLAGIEAGAEVNQTNAEIKAQYEANPDTNAFTDADEAKLDAIEAGAEVNQTNAEIKTQYEANANTNGFTDAEKTKLAGIEAGATQDQTAAEIKTQYESNANTNEFNDAEKSLLSKLAQGWLQYYSNSTITSSANYPAYTIVPVTQNLDSFTNGFFTKVNNTQFRTDFNGHVEIAVKANGRNTFNNDRTWLIGVLKNGTVIPQSIFRAAGKANANRETGLAGSFKISTSTNDVYQFFLSNEEGGQSVTLLSNETVFSITSIQRS